MAEIDRFSPTVPATQKKQLFNDVIKCLCST